MQITRPCLLQLLEPTLEKSYQWINLSLHNIQVSKVWNNISRKGRTNTGITIG